MKTIIYCNVMTGEAFDASGELRTENNPFTASCGEKCLIEWHLVSANNSSSPSAWPAFTAFDLTPSSGSLAVDDNFLQAYPGTLDSAVSADAASAVLALDVTRKDISSSGMIRIFRSSGTKASLAYDSFTETSAGKFSFHLTSAPGEAFSSGASAELADIPLARSADFLSGSTPSSGVFKFHLVFASGKISNIFTYQDLERLETKGLELRLAGLEENGSSTEILRCRVPFRILGVVDSGNDSLTPSSVQRTLFETWVLSLFSGGFAIQYRTGTNTWSSTAGSNVNAFRFRPSAVQTASWSAAVPLPLPAVDHSFTVEESNEEDEFCFAYSVLGRTSPFPAHLLRRQTDASYLDISSSSTIRILFNASGLVVRTFVPLEAGVYRIIG